MDIALDKMTKTAIIMIASFLEMWAAATICDSMRCQSNCSNGTYNNCKDEYAWAIAIGVISLVLTIVMLLIGKCAPGVAGGLPEMVIAFILFGGWFAAMAVCTMGLPFGGTGGGGGTNGFFCTWIALVFSWLLFLEVCPQLQALVDKASSGGGMAKKWLFAIGVASLIEMWHSAKICDDNSANGNYHGGNNNGNGLYDCTEMYGWAVSVGCISLFFALVFGVGGSLVPAVDGFTKYASIFFALWWIAGCVTLTMNNRDHPGIFQSISNGYCGTWAATFASIALCAACWGDSMPSGGGGGGDVGGGSSSPGVENDRPHDQEDPHASTAKL